MTTNVCPGCGYPVFGSGLCAFCQPALAANEAITPGSENPLHRDLIIPAEKAAG